MKINNLKNLLALALVLSITITGLILLLNDFSENSVETAQKDTQLNQQETKTNIDPHIASNTTANQLNTAQETLREITPSDTSATGKHIDDEKLAELMEKHLTPEMRQKINNMLEPNGEPPKIIETNQGSHLDLSDRASSVVIAIIEDDQLHVTDITNTLPE